MKILTLPKRGPVSAWEVAAIEATNNRNAVVALRKALRTALKAYCGTADGLAAHRAILAATEPSRLRGKAGR